MVDQLADPRPDPPTPDSSGSKRRIRPWSSRLWHWVSRYAPSELTGALAAMLAAVGAFAGTGDRTVAALAATAAECTAFYGVMLTRQWLLRRRSGDAGIRALAGVLRSLAVEFGPAEALDAIAVRPAAMAAGPLLTGGTASGTLLGKLAADLVFYALAIVGYERLRRRACPTPGPQRPT